MCMFYISKTLFFIGSSAFTKSLDALSIATGSFDAEFQYLEQLVNHCYSTITIR